MVTSYASQNILNVRWSGECGGFASRNVELTETMEEIVPDGLPKICSHIIIVQQFWHRPAATSEGIVHNDVRVSLRD